MPDSLIPRPTAVCRRCDFPLQATEVRWLGGIPYCSPCQAELELPDPWELEDITLEVWERTKAEHRTAAASLDSEELST